MDYSCPSASKLISGNITSSYQVLNYTEYNNCREDQVLINLVSQVR